MPSYDFAWRDQPAPPTKTPYRVDTLTDRYGVYEERWMVPPPGDVWFRVTAEARVTETCDTCGGNGSRHVCKGGVFHRYCTSEPCPDCVNGRCRVRVIHEWKAVEKRREL